MRKELFKNLLYLLCAIFTLGITGCSDKDEEEEGRNEQSVHLKAVADLIKLGGKLEEFDEYEKVETKKDTAWHLVLIIYPEGSHTSHSILTTKNVNANRNPDESVIYSPWSDVIWLGGLVQGKSLRNNKIPAWVPVYNKRVPGKIQLSVVSQDETMQDETIDEYTKETDLSPENVAQAMNDLIKSYPHRDTPAYTSYKIEKVSSIEEMALKLDIDWKRFGNKLKMDFGSSWSKDRSYVAVSLKQQFFTLTYKPPGNGISGIFTDDITVDDLKDYTGTDNPLCYVSSVTYGRAYTILYELPYSSNDLFESLCAAYNGCSLGEYDLSHVIVKDSKCTVTQLGSVTEEGLETVFGDFYKLRAFLTKGVTVSAENRCTPISFKTNLINDNTLAKLSNTLKYTVTEKISSPVEPRNDVEINVFDFVMQAPDPDRGFTVSNHSQFQIKSIEVGHSKDGQFSSADGAMYNNFENFRTSALSLKNGLGIPIYQTVFFPKVPKDHKIRIQCEVYVKSQSYGISTNTQEQTLTLIRDFEYNEDKNIWEPIENNLTKPFQSISLKDYPFARTKINCDLNFSFKHDNWVYPLD